MKRRHIYITDTQDKFLLNQKNITGLNFSDLVRRAIDLLKKSLERNKKRGK